MEKVIRNYRVIIKPDEYLGNDERCFTAYCPTLGLADGGDTVEESLTNIRSLIAFHLECLAQEGREIPAPDTPEDFVTITKIPVPFLQPSIRPTL